MPEEPKQEQPGVAPEAEAPTLEGLAAKLTQLEESHKTTVAALTKERDKYKKASELDPDTLADFTKAEAVEERATALIAREYDVDPDLLSPYAGLEAKEAAAQKMKAAGQAEVKTLRAQLAKLQETAASKSRGHGASLQGGMATSVAATPDTADALWLAGKITDAEYRKYLPR